MPRASTLNYDSNRNKWTSVYRGKKFRHDAGAGKSDREAKKEACLAWKAWMRSLDEVAETQRPHQREYERAIAQWESVLGVAEERNLDFLIQQSNDVLTELREELAKPKLEPIHSSRLFLPPTPLDQLDEDELLLMTNVSASNGDLVQQPPEAAIAEAKLNDRIWRDRVSDYNRRRHGIKPIDTVVGNVGQFLDDKREEANSGAISAGRADCLRVHLAVLTEFAGASRRIEELDGAFLSEFRRRLLKQISEKKYSTSYAKDILATTKQFIRWLSHTAGRLEHLPKNLESPQMSINTSAKAVETLGIAEVKQLLHQATPRTKLYVLLGLNCGMTQVDITQLNPKHIDWNVGTLTRRRSKTAHHENVPTVTYPLWPETLDLLRSERSKSTSNLLLTKQGLPLMSESINDKGKLKKRDAIRLAIRHLSKSSSIPCTMKHFKKTSASLIRNHPQFTGLEPVFLDHAPASTSAKSYTKIPQELLNQTVNWLGEEYGLLEQS